MYSLIADKTVLPVIDLVMGTRFYKYLKFFRESQWWDEEKLRDYQDMMLRKLIKHSYKNVPYYHRTFQELRINPEDIRTASDLKVLPIIDKQIVRKYYEDFFAQRTKIKKLIKRQSSGSTGQPFKYYLDKNSWSFAWAQVFRGFEVSGWKFGSKRITFVLREVEAKKKKSIFGFFGLIREILENNFHIYVDEMSPATMEIAIQEIGKKSPIYIRGFPSTLSSLSDYILEKNYFFQNVEAVFTYSEKLYPFQRIKIESAFRAPVFEGYGGSESGLFALQCGIRKGLHLCLDSGIFEVITGNRDTCINEIGELVTTNIFNYAMPLIRYRCGDMILNKLKWNCECGRHFPLIEDGIQGRFIEILKFSNGRTLYPLQIGLGYFDLDRYQIVQISYDSLEIRLIKGKEFNNQQFKGYLKKLQNLCGDEVKITYRFVNELPKSSGGKLKFIFSEINS